MSRKSAVIYASISDDPFLGPSPELDVIATRALADKLWPGAQLQRRSVSFLDGYEYPGKQAFAIGLYRTGAVYADSDVIPECIAEEPKPIVTQFLQLFPHGQVLVSTCFSGSNTFGYLLFEQGKLIRGYGGDCFTKGQIHHNIGRLLTIEEPYFKNSKIVRGKRVFLPPETEAIRRENDPGLEGAQHKTREISELEYYSESALGCSMVERIEERFLKSEAKRTSFLPVLYYFKKDHIPLSATKYAQWYLPPKE